MTFNYIKSTRLDTLSKTLYVFLVTLSILVTMANTSAAQGCGDTVLDPGGGGNYPNNTTWQETYTAGCAEIITISFTSFSTEQDYDYLRIYDGASTSSTLLATLSGTSLPADVVASGNEVTLSFISDGGVNAAGFELDIECNPNPDTSPCDIILEAECGILGSSWDIVEDASASGGDYVTVFSGNNYSGSTDPNDKITFNINVAQAGVYYVYARVLGSTSGNDSFFFRANGGSWTRWNSWNPLASSSFEWLQLYDSDNSNAIVTFNLVAGDNVIMVDHREDDSFLDKIFLSLDNTAPTGFGPDAGNCFEICGNGRDDDNDGLTDCEDSDCIGELDCQGPCVSGQLFVQRWNGVTGTDVSDLTDLAAFPDSPDEIGYIYSAQGESNIGDYYGSRVSGYIIPSETGTYSFNITGDDGTDLFMSPSNDPLTKVEIASIDGYTGTTQHTKFTSQTSIDFTLIAGQWYYIELLNKEGAGGDHYTIFWKTPSNSSSWTIIPGANLAPSECPEICDNIFDDDGDGDADCLDSDCAKNIDAQIQPDDAAICIGESTVLNTTTGSLGGGETYAWSGTTATSSSISVSPAATTTYTVTITNSVGCTDVASQQIVVNPLPTASANHNGAITCTKTTAVLSAEPSGNSYLWTGGSNSQSITVAAGGSYNVTVTNGNGCSDVATVIVPTDFSTPTASAGDNVDVCIGNSTTLTASGGVSYIWSNGVNNASISVSPNSNTTYTVTVTGANGCQSTDEVDVTVNSLPVVSLSDDGVINCINSDVTITALPAGLTYAWSGGGSGQTKTVASVGNYTVTVTDANGCAASETIEVTSDFSTPTFLARGDAYVCVGDSITISNTASWASAPITDYEWAGGFGSTNTIKVAPLVDTEYILTATATNGCTTNDTIQVFVNPLPVIIMEKSGAITCNENDVTLTANPSGLSYSWSNGSNGQSIIVNSSGTYMVSVADANGCINSASIEVITDNEPPTVSLKSAEFCSADSVILSPEVCETYPDIIAQRPLNMPGWNNPFGDDESALVGDGELCFTIGTTIGSSLQAIGLNSTPNQAGTTNDLDFGYVLAIRADLSIFTVQLKEEGTVVFSNDFTKAAFENSTLCIRRIGNEITYYRNNALVHTSVVSSTGNLYYDHAVSGQNSGAYINGYSEFTDISLCGIVDMGYAWSTGELTREIYASNAGNYTVTVTDAKGCTSETTTSVLENSLPLANILNDGPITCDDGTVTLTALPPNLTYIWSNGSTAPAIDIVADGMFSVTVIDANGCRASASSTVTTALPPVVSITGSDEICIGGTTTLSPSSGGEWTSSDQNIAIVSNSGNVVGREGGKVVLTFEDNATGCTATTDSITVSPEMNVAMDFIGGLCLTENSKLGVIVEGGTPDYTYSWAGPASFASTDEVIDINVSGNYYVTITDSFGCTESTSGYVYEAYDPYIFSLNTEVCDGEMVNLSVNSGSAVSYAWSTGIADTLSSITVTPSPPFTTYTVTITNDIGCQTEADIRIDVNTKTTVDVTGPTSICEGDSTSLSPSAGGVWSSSDNNVALVTPDGIVIGLSAGDVSFIFTDDSKNCTSDPTETVTIRPKPIISVTGPTSICEGETNQLTPSSGGSWSSSDNSVATIDMITGEVTGVGPGTATFNFYNASTGCTSDDSAEITIHEVFDVKITGDGELCVGDLAILAPNFGGTWTSSDTTVATIDNLGVVTAVGGGTAYFVFTSDFNCVSPQSNNINVTVNDIIVISGENVLCEDDTTQLTANSTNGTWSSDNNTIASIDANGIVTAIAAGTVTINYTHDPNICAIDTTFDMTILGKPVTNVTGAVSLCIGEDTQVSTSVTGGVWSSTDDLIALVSQDGTVVAVSEGVAAFIYEGSNGCFSDTTDYITVQPPISVDISFNGSECLEDNTQLTANVTGGTAGFEYLWSGPGGFTSTDPTIDVLLSGNYTIDITDTVGCPAQYSVFVYERYEPFVFTLDTEICEGDDITLSVNGSNGGTFQWSANAGGTATQSVTVVPTKPSSSYTVTITSPQGCVTVASSEITVNEIPSISVLGDTELCSGNTTILEPTTGGTWSSSDYSVATINNAGFVTGLSAGSAVFTYRSDITGCYSEPSVPIIVTDNAPVTINGDDDICIGTPKTLTATVAGGSWYSSNPAIAIIDTITGEITPVSQGFVTMTYVTAGTLCFEEGIKDISVRNIPSVNINGPATICEGAQTFLIPTSGGVWTSSDESVATVSPLGVVTAISGGTASFSFTSIFGCITDLGTDITVIDEPVTSNGGDSELCLNETTTLVSNVNGIWVSSNSQVASVNSQGEVLAKKEGVAEFSFIELSNGCESTVPIVINVNGPPLINGFDDNEICIGETTNITPNTEGVWVSSDESIATITNQGLITAVSAGAVTFVYTSNLTGCSSAPSNSLTIDGKPSVTINGATELCVGETSTILPGIGGTWSSSDVTIASINDQGEITAISSGSVNFTFTSDDTGCSSDPSEDIVVSNPASTVLNGPSNLCIGENSMLTSPEAGTWSSSNDAIGTVNNNGQFTAIAPGVVTITLNTTGACIANPTLDILVNPVPSTMFLGSSAVCIDGSTTLSPLTGGTWTSSDESVATVTNDGVVTAHAEGSAEFTYTDLNSGCSSTTLTSLNVFGKPVTLIAGDNEICIGGTTSMSPSAGGTWTSSDESIATISTTGNVTGLSAGQVRFIFTEFGTGCVSDESSPITVRPKPVISITGLSQICEGFTTTLEPTSGGSWISDDEAIATITDGGVVTGVGQGIVRFTFISNDGCSSDESNPIIVNGAPTISVGTTSLCIGETIGISPSSGGTWVSSDNGVATITANGMITGVAPGEVRFTFTETNSGCVSNPSDLITVSPAPEIGYNGPQEVCIGGTTNLVPTTGGVWESLDDDIATIDNNGMVTGVSSGTTRFIFTDIITGCSSDTSDIVTITSGILPVYIGDTELCIGDTSYISPSSGGTWTSTDDNVASIDNNGMIIALGQGTTKFQYTQNGFSCSSELSDPFLVNGAPTVSISGSPQICIGGVSQLFSSTAGSWNALQPSIATVDQNGVVTGVTQGDAYFMFTDSITGCDSDGNLLISVQTGTTISVIGASEICVGYTTSLEPSTGGVWTSTNPEIATITNAGIVTGRAAGKVSFQFEDSNSGCISMAPDDLISVSNCKNHDFNVTVANKTISGDASTNDNMPLGTTYSSAYLLLEKPTLSNITFDINSDGTYSFVADRIGNYRFNIPVCGPGQSSGCATTILEITVVDNIYSMGSAVANIDLASTFRNDDILLVGNPIEIDVLANDRCVYTIGCDLDSTTVSILPMGSANGVTNINPDYTITYTPNAGFIGYDTIHYEVCTLDGSCNNSMEIISVNDPSAANSTVASDDFGFTIVEVATSGNALENDSDPEGDTQSVVAQGTLMTPVSNGDGTYFIESNGFYTFTPNEGFSGNTEITYTVCDDNPEIECTDATIHLLVFGDISINVKVYIEGALIENGNELSTKGKPLMRDDLRVSPYTGELYIPTKDPYTVAFSDFYNLYDKFSHLGPHLLEENQIINDSLTVFGVTGENAIVDWIHVELRSKDDINVAIASRSGLLQRDGDVVDLDGVSSLRFQGLNVDSIYVVAKHRSHLGVMSKLVHYNEIIDFTDADFEVWNYGTSKNDGRDYSGLSMKDNVKNGYRACWAGDLDGNGNVKFSAPDDDQAMIYTDVLFSSPSFLINFDEAIGYYIGDYNLDSKAKYTNPNDDKNLLYSQVFLYPLNSSYVTNFSSMIEQIPERSN